MPGKEVHGPGQLDLQLPGQVGPLRPELHGRILREREGRNETVILKAHEFEAIRGNTLIGEGLPGNDCGRGLDIPGDDTRHHKRRDCDSRNVTCNLPPAAWPGLAPW